MNSKLIVNIENMENAVVINTNDLEKAVFINDTMWKHVENESININFVDQLNTWLSENDIPMDYNSIDEFCTYKEIENEFEELDEVEILTKDDNFEIIYMNDGRAHICDIRDLEVKEVCRFWVNGNWKTYVIENVDFKFYESDCEYVKLDEWDGRNFQTGGLGCHSKVTKIKDKYYIFEWTDFASSIFTEVLECSESQLKEYLENNDRMDYLEKILSLKYDEDV